MFQVQTVSVSSRMEKHSRLKRSFKVWDAARVLFRKAKPKLNFEQAKVNTVKPLSLLSLRPHDILLCKPLACVSFNHTIFIMYKNTFRSLPSSRIHLMVMNSNILQFFLCLKWKIIQFWDTTGLHYNSEMLMCLQNNKKTVQFVT